MKRQLYILILSALLIGCAGKTSVTLPTFSKITVTPEQATYAVGDQVRHVKFGVGKVLAITDSGRDYLVTADFPGWGIKKMYASFAKLIKEE